MTVDVSTIVTVGLAILSGLIAWLGWSIKTGFTGPVRKLTEQMSALNDFLETVRNETTSKIHDHDIQLTKHEEQIKTLFEKGDK